MPRETPDLTADRAASEDLVYSVSELNREVRFLLDDALPMLRVEGEISNLSRPASGHLYFSLKDAQAQVDCAMFRSANRSLAFHPNNGDAVLLRAKAGLYEQRGRFQLIVQQMEPAGEGLLLRKLAELKKRLDAEGLFDPSKKLPLPLLPSRIGIVTSPTGAAVRDILNILARRFPAIPVIVYPTAVQGDAARDQIAAAIAVADSRAECDVLIVARGGGSLEDLWPFNEEVVARAMAACSIPIVSGVGHETDVTITDLVADRRAPTPSGAAELVVPDASEWLTTLRQLDARLARATQRELARRQQMLLGLAGRLERQHPGILLSQRAQRIDELMQRAAAGLRNRLAMTRLGFTNLSGALRRAAPLEPIRAQRRRLRDTLIALGAASDRQISERRQRVAVLAAGLSASSPLGTLARGYAIVHNPTTGAVIRDAQDVTAGDAIEARLARGRLVATVKKTQPE